MDSLVDALFSLKDSLQDGLLVFPHLLSGFFFFIGILTSNIGMLSLAVGHLLVVPCISYFANNEWPMFIVGTLNIKDLAFSLLPALVLGFCLMDLSTELIYSIPLMYLLKLIIPFIMSDIKDTLTLFDALNPYVLFVGEIHKKPESTVNLCYLSPEDTFTGENQRRTPSGWTIHILFFVGFLISNAISIYSLPTPTFVPSGDDKVDINSKISLDARVNNRKFITALIVILSLILLFVLLYIRFSMSPCEDEFYQSLFPMIYCFILGCGFYLTLTTSCGISAADILGLVQGFISPNAIDNPIVCIGTDPGPQP
jgi:hypothetical protein